MRSANNNPNAWKQEEYDAAAARFQDDVPPLLLALWGAGGSSDDLISEFNEALLQANIPDMSGSPLVVMQ